VTKVQVEDSPGKMPVFGTYPGRPYLSGPEVVPLRVVPTKDVATNVFYGAVLELIRDAGDAQAQPDGPAA
jgi:hypothetical protein